MDIFNEHFLPELQSIKGDVEYLKHLRKRLWDVEHRISQAVEAIPALEKEIQAVEESRQVSSAALATLLSTSERVSALAAIGPRNQFVQSHLPTPTIRSTTSSTLAELITHHSAIPEKLDNLRKTLETARSVMYSGDTDHKRLQNILHATVAAIIAKYELVHPIHRLPRRLLTRIFALVVSEEYAAAASTLTSGKEVRPLVSPTCLSLVCYHWRDIAYAAGSLWNRILITAQSPPSPFRTTDTQNPAFILAAAGNDSLNGDGGSRIARHIESLASRMSIHELTYSGGAFESVRECIAMLPRLKRLSLTYAKPKSDPVVITLPETLDELTYLSCTHAYPLFNSTLAALETLAISVRSGGTETPPLLDCLFAKAPNLKTLLLSRTPDLVVGSDIEHYSLTSIKAHMSAFRPLASALREGKLSLPTLSLLELHNISRESILLKWEEMFVPSSWSFQIVNLRLVFASRAAWTEGPDGVHKMFAPFPSLESLSIVREDRPELLLLASRRALMSKLTHIKVENSACYGVALLNHAKQYNDRREVLNGEVSQLTHVELFNCPNVAAGVMEQLRVIKGVGPPVMDQARKYEAPTPPAVVPLLPSRSPSSLPLVVPESLVQAPQPGEAESYALGEKASLPEVPVQGDAVGELLAPSEPAPPDPTPLTSPQLETPVPQVQGEIKRPEGVALVPEKPKGILTNPPPPLPPLLQRPQSERVLTSVRRQQWSGFCL